MSDRVVWAATILETADPSASAVVAPGRSDQLAHGLINVLREIRCPLLAARLRRSNVLNVTSQSR